MSSLRWIILLFVVMGGGFAVYLWTQPTSPPPTRRGPAADAPPATRARGEPPATAMVEGQTAGPGEDVWVKSYDQKTGELSSQFKADRFDPQADNSVDVTAPVAEFFQNDGQILRVRGTRGRVVLPGEAGQGNDFRTQSGPPTRGDLFDVTIELFKSAEAEAPFLRCEVPNVRFDNDTFSIATESYRDASGNEIPADRVPVVVSGDYDFKGQGLLIRWNERDRRLQLLEIAHGDTLTIRDAAKMGQMGGSSNPSTRPEAGAIEPPARVALAAAEDEAVRTAPAATRPAARKPARRAEPAALAPPAIERDRAPASYRATFFDEVKVFQSGRQIADADVMHVDFTEADDDRDQATTNPTTRPAAARPATRRAAARAATRTNTRPATTTAIVPAAIAPATIAPATARAATRSAATLPAGPVTIHWKGKLRVTPPPADVPRVAPAQMAVEMTGGKTGAVTLSRDGTTIRCGSFRYDAGEDSLVVRRSEFVPEVLLADAGGMKLFTQGIDYDGRQKKARLNGAGRAEVPLNASDAEATTRPATPSANGAATRPADRMLATWTGECALRLSGESRETLSFDRATLSGDVSVDHPQLKLASGTLDLGFADEVNWRSTTRPASRTGVVLRKLDATENVRCTFIDANGDAQNIRSQRLTLDTATGEDGRVAPKKLSAEGSVHAYDGKKNDLRANRLEATLATVKGATTASTTRHSDESAFAAVEVESIDAQQDVIFSGADGTHASAEDLRIRMVGGKPVIDLQGTPATVGNKTDTVAGPIVKFDPAAGTAQVLGGGTLTSYRSNISPSTRPAGSATSPASKPGDTPATARPVIVAWQGGLKVDAPANRVDVDGGVTISSAQGDGTNTVAGGKRLTITLRDKPAPSERSGATTRPSDDPSTQPANTTGLTGLTGLDVGSFGEKDVAAVVLEEGVEIGSILNGPDGLLLRRMHLSVPLLRYEAEHRRTTVPAPGRLLFQDERRAPTPATNTADNAATPFAGLGEFKGATAFEWKKQLSYDEAAGRIRMEGDVVIVHQDTVGVSDVLQIRAGEVIADLERAGATPDGSATGTLGSDAKLKLLQARGGVRLTSPQLQFDGDRIEFDPANSLLVATGSDAFPVTLYDDRGASKGTFSELRYNTKTGQLNLKGLRAGVRR